MTDDRIAPRVEHAPGIVWQKNKHGWTAYWIARSDIVKRGYKPARTWLWRGEEVTADVTLWLADRCRTLQTEMLIWGRGGLPITAAFDGTLGSLIGAYRSDPDSTYRNLRYRTRQHYDSTLNRIDEDHGHELLKDIRGRQMRRWYEEWQARGTAMAHGLMSKVRTIVNFGATILEDEECARLAGILHGLKFKMAKARESTLTAEQAEAIRAKAHELGHHSIALAQAFQFDLMLRQRDVIGEWVPANEPGISEVTHAGQKWLRGITWREIDGTLILRHTTSKRQKDIQVDLKLAPMVMEELAFIGERPTTGAVVVREQTGLPWESHNFRYHWRKIARMVGVPDDVFNMDSRAGAISEATDAGASLESIRHAATHSDIAMTQRYSRNQAEKTAEVMKLRVANRNKTRT